MCWNKQWSVEPNICKWMRNPSATGQYFGIGSVLVSACSPSSISSINQSRLSGLRRVDRKRGRTRNAMHLSDDYLAFPFSCLPRVDSWNNSVRDVFSQLRLAMTGARKRKSSPTLISADYAMNPWYTVCCLHRRNHGQTDCRNDTLINY